MQEKNQLPYLWCQVAEWFCDIYTYENTNNAPGECILLFKYLREGMMSLLPPLILRKSMQFSVSLSALGTMSFLY